MATRLRQPGAGFTDSSEGMGDNLFASNTNRRMTAPSMAPQGDQGQMGQPPPQLPQVPIVGNGQPPMAAPQRNYSQQPGGGGNIIDAIPNGGPLQDVPPAPDVSRRPINTDGYATPQRLSKTIGNAPAGYDAGKWADESHQTPKYVSARFQAEAGDQKDPANRQKYLDMMKESYGEDNFRFNGKDKISIDGGKTFVDVWGGSKAGEFSTAWQDESSQGGPAAQNVLGGGPSPKPDVQLRTQAPPTTSGGGASSASGGSSQDPFGGRGVRLAGGEWVPNDHPLASGPKWGVPSGGPAGDPAAPESAPAPGGDPAAPSGGPVGAGGEPEAEDPNSIQSLIKKMMSGDLNEKIVNRRVDSARDVLNKQRSSSSDTLRASLAERGQLGSGAGDSADVRLNQALGDDFAMEVNDIYANEGENADKRLMSALGFGSAMETADKDRVVDQYNADTGRLNSDRNYEIGKGDLDVRRRSVDNDFDLGNRRLASDDSLGNRRIDTDNRRIDVDERLGNRGLDVTERGQNIDWDKFASQFGLDQEKFGESVRSGDLDRIIELLRIQGGNAGTASGGFY